MDTFGKNKIKLRATPRSGQALVEVMVAVAILAVGFLGVVALLSRALALNRVVADNYVGTYLAAEGIEVTKNIIDGNILQRLTWNTGNFVSSCGHAGDIGGCQVDYADSVMNPGCSTPLSFDLQTKLYSYRSAPQPTSFRRCVFITLIGQNELKVESQVTWVMRGGGTSEVTLEDHFYNWRQ